MRNQMKQKYYREGDAIFTTGAFLQAIKVKINGVKQWRWVVTSFEENSYFDGECINPVAYADKLEDMIENYDDE